MCIYIYEKFIMAHAGQTHCFITLFTGILNETGFLRIKIKLNFANHFLKTVSRHGFLFDYFSTRNLNLARVT